MTQCFTDSCVPLFDEFVLISIHRCIKGTVYDESDLVQYITVIGRSGTLGNRRSGASAIGGGCCGGAGTLASAGGECSQHGN